MQILPNLPLKKEIAVMDNIMRRVNVVYPRISPYRAQMRLNTEVKRDLFEPCVKKLGDIVDVNRSKSQSMSLYDLFINDAENVKQSKLGDCGESSALMMSSLLANGYKDGEIVRLLFRAEARDITTNELIATKMLDTTHELVVRNMNSEAVVESPKTYGKKVVVLDAWAGFCANIQESFQKYYEIFLNGMRDFVQPKENIVISYKPVLHRVCPKEAYEALRTEEFSKRFPKLIV